jgi:hypothetical protein
MRSIDDAIKAKLLQNIQTKANNNNPVMEIEAIRPRTAIFNKRFWVEAVITEDVTATSTSVAVQRMGKYGSKVYVAYIAGGTLYVKSAPLVYPYNNLAWITELTLSGCAACALEFDGNFKHGDFGRVEYHTTDLWLFYTTTSGQLMAGILGGTYESLIGANVTAIDAVRGVASIYKDIDQGLIVFYIIAGVVYYKQCIAGVWGDPETVSIAPENAVHIRAERVFDWRIVLQVTDNTGDLYEIFTKMEASGWNSSEHAVSLAEVTTTLDRIRVSYSEFENDDEAIAMTDVLANIMQMSIHSATLRKAWNIPTQVYDEETEEYYDDYGFAVVFEFNQIIVNAAAYPADFKLLDDNGVSWFGQVAAANGRFVTVTFNNFNNAANPITAKVLAGNLSNGYVDLEETEVAFNAENLVPFASDPPVPVGIWNLDNQRILIEFDKPVVDITSQEGFEITGYEPDMSPEGELIETEYVVDAIEMADPERLADFDFSLGILTDVEVV